jgi:hypothetical protein
VAARPIDTETATGRSENSSRGDGQRRHAVRVAQDDGELRAAEPRRHVGAARAPAQDVGEPAQHVVAGLLAELVVDAGELVEVADEDGYGAARGDLVLDARLEVALVAHARQRVVGGEVAQVLELAGRLDGADRLVGERAQGLEALGLRHEAVLGLVDPHDPGERAVAVVQRHDQPVVLPRLRAAAVAPPAMDVVQLGRGEELGLLAGEQHAALVLVLRAQQA